MKEHCRDEKYDEDSDGLCHTVNVKKCQTEYKPSTTKVKVRVCPDGAVDLDDESKHKMQDNRYALLPSCVFKQIFFNTYTSMTNRWTLSLGTFFVCDFSGQCMHYS